MSDAGVVVEPLASADGTLIVVSKKQDSGRASVADDDALIALQSIDSSLRQILNILQMEFEMWDSGDLGEE